MLTDFHWLKEWYYRDPCGYSWRLDIFINTDQTKYRIYHDGKAFTGTTHKSLESAMAEAEWYVQHLNDRYHDKLKEI